MSDLVGTQIVGFPMHRLTYNSLDNKVLTGALCIDDSQQAKTDEDLEHFVLEWCSNIRLAMQKTQKKHNFIAAVSLVPTIEIRSKILPRNHHL